MANVSLKRKDSGAVSLFVVIFAMLIITVLVVSFLRLMMSDQNQATNANLAEGARNSAMAGVEDAKRSLLRYLDYCSKNSESDCDNLATRLSTDTCNAAVRIGNVVGSSVQNGGTDDQPGEIRVQQVQNTNDTILDQAYTCVTIKLDTEDYIGNVGAGETHIVPLSGTDSFSNVTVQWFSREDISSGSTNVSLAPSSQKLLTSNWPANRPPVLRVQLMQFGNSFRLTDFDSVTASGESNTNTAFLYPSNNGFTSQQLLTGIDNRRLPTDAESPADNPANSPRAIRCETSLASGGYSCTTTLVLPNPVGGGDRTAFLRLVPFYNSTHFRVTLSNPSTGSVRFKAIQPEVDSTGRANNVFKRVASRIDLYNTGSVFPNAAVDVTGNFCKDFSVTDTNYIAGTCTP